MTVTDPAVATFWLVVRDLVKILKLIIQGESNLNHEDFELFRQELLDLKKVPRHKGMMAHIAFYKLFVQRTSFSGLGTKSSQACKNILERWNPDNLINELEVLSKLMNDNIVRVSNHDFEPLLTDDSRKALIYLDPPYFKKGKGLYQYHMDVDDHVRLACVLKNTAHPFVMSYDDCEEVHDLYESWTTIKPFPLEYTCKNQRRIHNELLIIRK